MLHNQILALNRIIERESKSSTYKFALIRSTIDSINYYRAHYTLSKDRYTAPIGLLVESWIFYYYPLFEGKSIPQIAGQSKKLSFEDSLNELISIYRTKGGLSAFYIDYMKFNFDFRASETFFQLFKNVRNTVAKMPMRYFGNSVSTSDYSYYKVERLPSFKSKPTSRLELLLTSGNFTIQQDYFQLLSLLGNLINGTDSIVNKWADYSYMASNKCFSRELILSKLNTIPVNKRERLISDNHFKKIVDPSDMLCVWTGKKLRTFHLDHLIPYSIMNNNDLWNLLPAQPKINLQKRDKIPSSSRLEESKDRIFFYWNSLEQNHRLLFESQIKLSMNIDFHDGDRSFNPLLNKLKIHSDYLINTKGYEAW